MGYAREVPEPSLGYRWIKASVYGALVSLVAGLLIFAMGKVLTASNPDTGIVVKSLFVAVGCAITVCALAVFARLTGGALRIRLPRFPMRGWIVLHAILGFVFGVGTSIGATMPEHATSDLPSETAFVPLMLVVVAALIGAVFGALFGALQALVLRRAARSVWGWIGYSALGGAWFGPAILISVYGSRAGLATDVAWELTRFIVALAAAVTLLPAVRRLQPREATTPSPDAPPPP